MVKIEELKEEARGREGVGGQEKETKMYMGIAKEKRQRRVSAFE